jgi:hypothetical protein
LVFLVKEVNSGKEYALKELIAHKKEVFENVCQEILTMNKLANHTNIMKILGSKIVLNPGNVFIF